MNQEKVGEFIAECRKQKKLTQVELGEKLGVTEKSVSNWENGKEIVHKMKRKTRKKQMYECPSFEIRNFEKTNIVTISGVDQGEIDLQNVENIE